MTDSRNRESLTADLNLPNRYLKMRLGEMAQLVCHAFKPLDLLAFCLDRAITIQIKAFHDAFFCIPCFSFSHEFLWLNISRSTLANDCKTGHEHNILTLWGVGGSTGFVQVHIIEIITLASV